MTTDPADVPSIAAMLTEYRDRTGASYEDMSKAVGGAVSDGRFHQLTTKPQKGFPEPATIKGLADLLQVPVTTILNAFAVSLGLPVPASGSSLSISLPPGTDSLTAEDVAAVRAIIRQLVRARQDSDPRPDLTHADKIRVADPDLTASNSDSQTSK